MADDISGIDWPVEGRVETGSEHTYAGHAYLLAVWWLTQAAAGEVPSGDITDLFPKDQA